MEPDNYNAVKNQKKVVIQEPTTQVQPDLSARSREAAQQILFDEHGNVDSESFKKYIAVTRQEIHDNKRKRRADRKIREQQEELQIEKELNQQFNEESKQCDGMDEVDPKLGNWDGGKWEELDSSSEDEPNDWSEIPPEGVDATQWAIENHIDTDAELDSDEWDYDSDEEHQEEETIYDERGLPVFTGAVNRITPESLGYPQEEWNKIIEGIRGVKLES